MSDVYADLLADKYEVTINGEKLKIGGSKLMQIVARDILMRRDSSSVSLMREIREATEGNNVNLSGTVNTLEITVGMSYDEKVALARDWVAKNL